MSKPILTQSRLRELFNYDQETGVFTRLKLSGRRVKLTAPVGVPDSLGYLRVSVDSTRERLHRLAFLYMDGKLPDQQVDHIDRNRTNNKWANLRQVTAAQNQHNSSASSRNWSGTTGVSWNPLTCSWRVRLSANHQQVSLGQFHTLDEAVNARNAAKRILHPTAPVAQQGA